MFATTKWRWVICFGLAACLSSSAAWAQELNWAQKMLEKQSIDFGVVARGADCRTQLKVRNLYKEDIRITEVRTSCGCSSAKKVVDVIPSGETTYLDISMDTVRFMRQKDSAAIVTFFEPSKGLIQEVRIPLSVYIRTDVVLTPGKVEFGIVDLGQTAQRTIEIAYAGRPDWQISGVQVSNPLLKASVAEKSRNGGSCSYVLTVDLAASPTAGLLQDQLLLVTNDSSNPHVPVPVEARVESDITITPSEVVFGAMKVGQTRTLNVVIRSRKPITIEKIEREKGDEAFKVRLPTEARPVHILPLTFAPTEGSGDYEDVFTVTITGRPEPVTFRAKARLEAADPAPAAE